VESRKVLFQRAAEMERLLAERLAVLANEARLMIVPPGTALMLLV